MKIKAPIFFLFFPLLFLANADLLAQSIYIQNGVIKVEPYDYPGLDAATKAQLEAIKNLSTTSQQEAYFWKHAGLEMDRSVKTSGSFGNRFGENEKSSYPQAMSTMIYGAANNNSSLVTTGANYLMADDNQGGGMASYTKGVDLYYSFTLKGQVPKYFYFGKKRGDLTPEYMEEMQKGIFLWTHRYLEENGSTTDPVLPTPIVGDDIKNRYTERSPFYRGSPIYTGAGPSWGPDNKNSWVDIRGTDNLRSMRETSIYLLAEDAGFNVAANIERPKIINHVNVLYNVGYSEWESDTYFAHVLMPYHNLYAYTRNPEMKKVAKAGLDWYHLAGAAKYYRGSQIPPSKRVYEERFVKVGSSEAGQIGLMYYGGVPESYSIPADVRDRDAYITMLSSYRPPQAVYGIGTHDMQHHVEILGSKNNYGQFSTTQSSPEAREFVYYGDNYLMASAAYSGANSDMTDNGMTHYSSTIGSEGLFVFRPDADGTINYSKQSGHQIGQYRNVRAHLQTGSRTPFYIMTASERNGVQVPTVEVDANGNQVVFFEYEQSWVAVRLLNMSYSVTVGHDESTGARYGGWWTTDESGQKDVHIHQFTNTGGSYAGMLVEVGEVGSRNDQYSNFAAFKTAIKSRTPDLSNFNTGELRLTTQAGQVDGTNEFVKVGYNTGNDFPKLWRNSETAYDWYDSKHNFDTYRSITPPLAQLNNVTTIDGNTGIRIEATAFDPEIGPINQAWRGGKLTVVSGAAGTASGFRYESEMSSSGVVSMTEVPITSVEQRRGTIVLVQLYVDGIRVADITDASAIADLANGSFVYDWSPSKGGTDMVVKLRAEDAQGNEAWSNEMTVTVANGDADAPATPTTVSANALSATSIQLGWDDNSESDISGYNVYRGTTVGFTPSPQNLVAERVSTSSYIDEGLAAGQQYYYKISALDIAFNESAPTNSVQGISMSVLNLAPIEDTYVSNTELGNHGSASALKIKEGYRVPVMLFDLSGIGNDKSIVEAKLKINVREADPNGNDIQIAVVEYTEQVWDEMVLDQTNMEGFSGNNLRFATPIVSANTITAAGGSYQEYELDITDFLRDQKIAGRNLSLILSNRNHLNSLPGEVASKESGSRAPVVEVTYIDSNDGDAPSAVTGLAVSEAVSNNISIQWNPSLESDVFGYYVYRSTSAGFTPSASNMIAWGVKSTSFDDENLAGATTYYYKVSARDLSGNESPVSNEVSATTDLFTVKTVIEDTYTDAFNGASNFGSDNLIKIKRNGNQWIGYMKFDISNLNGIISSAILKLNGRVFENPPNDLDIAILGMPDGAPAWSESTLTYANRPTNPVDVNESGFIRNSANFIAPLTNVSGFNYTWWEWDITSYVRNQLLDGKQEITLLVASNDIDASFFFYTKENGAATAPKIEIGYQPGDTDPPTPPAGLTTTDVGGTNATLAWAQNSEDDFYSYSVYRSTSPSVAINEANLVESNILEETFEDTGLEGLTTYYYVVTAKDLSGNESTASNEVEITTKLATKLNVLEDAFVFASSPDLNYGAAELQYLKRNSREIFVSVDLSALTQELTNLTLRMHGKLGDNKNTNISAAIYAVQETWAEGTGSQAGESVAGITWNTKPSNINEALAIEIIEDEDYKWYEWNITEYARTQLALGNTTLSFVVKFTQNSDSFGVFYSSESGINPPEFLAVTEDATAAAIPVITLASGDYFGSQSVEITTTETAPYQIRYTTNGGTPNTNSTLYSDPISIENSLTLKAKVFKDGVLSSPQAVAYYNITPKTCAEPYDFVATEITTDSTTLSWLEGNSNLPVLGYDVVYGTGGVFDTLYNITSTSVVLTDLAEATTYSWYVRTACDDQDVAASGYSVENTFTTLTNCDGKIPGDLSDANANICTIDLSWNEIAGVTNYQLEYRDLTNGGDWQQTTSGNATYTLRKLDAATDYEWRVRTYCSGTESTSAFSAISTFSTTATGECLNYPTDNPYRTLYPTAATGHWTDGLPWDQIIDAVDYGMVSGGDMATNGATNYTALMNAINAAEANGGGVVFIETGTYFIDPGTSENGVRLGKGVILRGETPIMNDAKQTGFAPPTRLEFPEYIWDDTGSGTPNNTAFKNIHSYNGDDGIGVVNLDLNRVHMSFWVPLGTVAGYQTRQALETKENIIVLGTRTNNAARPFSNIPLSWQHQYQRLPNAYAGANIAAFATKNVVVANNRLNDAITDNHTFESYLIRNLNNSGQFFDLTNDGGVDRRITFDHADQYGIIVNRNKGDYIWGAPKSVEPLSHIEGVEILDNWMFRSNRVGIWSGGDGSIIKGNVITDRDNKPKYTGSNGYESPRIDQTYENRGIDFVGFDVTVEDNEIAIFQNTQINVFTGDSRKSTDGEAILYQECCGGQDKIEGAFIRNNSIVDGTDPYIGIWKTKDIRNLQITNNDLGGHGAITVIANRSIDNTYYGIWDSEISGNTNVAAVPTGTVMIDGIKVVASNGGQNLTITNNAAATANTEMLYPSFATVSGNTNFAPLEPYASPYPVIDDFSPANACVGQEVTIVGRGLLNVTEVLVDGIAANTITESDGNVLVFEVPAGATSGVLTVNVQGALNTEGGHTPTIPGSQAVSQNSLTIDAICVQQEQTITFNALPAMTFGDAAFNLVATASSELPVSFTVVSGSASLDGNTLSITGAGLVTVRADQPGSVVFFPATPVEQSFNVSQAANEITFNEIADVSFGDADFDLTATASSELDVSFAVVSGPATLSGNTVTITGTGAVTIEATQVGDADYVAATPVQQSFNVLQAANTITFNEIADATFGDAPFNLNATSSSGLPVTFSVVSGSITLDGNQVTIVGAGAVTIEATQVGDVNYAEATPVQQSFDVLQAVNTIAFDAISDKAYGDPDFDISATASSGLAVSFTVVSGPAVVSGNTVSITGIGAVTIEATQDGDTDYASATPIQQSFNVTQASQYITFDNLQNKTLGDPDFNLVATASSGLPVTFTVVSGPATLSGPTVSLIGEGLVVIQADQAGDANYLAAPPIQRSFTVNPMAVVKQNQTITFAQIEDKSTTDASFTLSAASSSGLPITYTLVSGPATVSGNTVALTGTTGTVVVRASQAGDDDYNPATDVDRSFEVLQAPSVLVFERGKIEGVSSNWQTVNLTNTYNSPVVVATPVTDSGDSPVVTRIRNASGTSFEIKVQNPSNSVVSGRTVHYMVVEEGVYTVAAHGIKMEAQKVLSTNLAYKLTWGSGNLEQRSYANAAGYNNPVVLGQVMTENDPNWSVFWASSDLASNPPTGSSFYAGKHVGEDSNTSRADETIGYVVFESGNGTIDGITMTAGLGADNVQGFDNTSTGYAYSFSGVTNPGIAIVSAAAMDGADGGFPILYGNTSVMPSEIRVAFDEDQIGDSERAHTTEQVAYVVFEGDEPIILPQTITFNAIPNKTTTSEDFDITASASSGLPVLLSVLSGPATIVGNTVSLTGPAGTVVIRASQSGDATYEAATPIDQQFDVVESSPTFAYQQSTGTDGLVVMEAEGFDTNTPQGDHEFILDYLDDYSGTAAMLASPNLGRLNNTNYESNSPRLDYQVNFTQTGTHYVWIRMHSQGSGNDDSFHAGLDGIGLATSDRISISGNEWRWTKNTMDGQVASFEVSSTGIHTFNIWMREDGSRIDKIILTTNPNYVANTAEPESPREGRLEDQTITFNPISDKTFGDADFDLAATASSGLAVEYKVVSGPATVTGTTVSITGTGTVTIEANQAGNTDYNPAPAVQHSFTVNSAAQTIDFAAISDMTFGDADFDLSATASSGLTVAYTVVSGPVTLSGNTVSITGAGSVTIEANQAGDANYNAALAVQQTFDVLKASQAIDFTVLPDKTFGDADFELIATATSGLPVSFNVVSGSATISGSTVSITGGGAVTIAAIQVGDANYEAATVVQQSFNVAQAIQTISFAPLDNKNTTDVPFDLTATASSGLPVSYSVVSGPASIAGSTVTLDGSVGTVVIRASQSGSANYGTAADVDQQFDVEADANAISFHGNIINWTGSDKVTTTSNFRGINEPSSVVDIDGDGADDRRVGYAFSDATPFSATSGYAATPFYGGAIAELPNTTSGGFASNAVFNGSPHDRLDLRSQNAGDFHMVIFYDKADFAGLAADNPVSFTSQSSLKVADINRWDHITARWLVREGNTFYVSEQTAVRSNNMAELTFTTNGSDGNWAVYDPTASANMDFDQNNAVFQEMNFSNVTGVGLMFDQDSYEDRRKWVTFGELVINAQVGAIGGPSDQTITFDPIPTKTFGDADFNINATASSGLPVSYSLVSGPATLSGTTVSITGAGDVIIRASQAGDENFNPAPDTDELITINKASQTIDFAAISDMTFGDADFDGNATASSGLAVTYNVLSGSASVSGSTITITGAGAITLEATQAGNANYEAATAVQQSFNVAKADQTITFNTPVNHSTTDAPFDLSATTTSGLPISYTIVSGPASISGSTVTLDGNIGTVVVRASQAGDANYNSAVDVEQQFDVIDGPVLPNPVAQWLFNNNTDDATGNGNIIALTGTTYSTDANEGSHSLELNGTSDFVNLIGADDATFLHDEFTERSITMWVKADATSGTYVLFEEGGSTHGISIRINNNQLEARVRVNTTSEINLSAPFNYTDWMHITLVFDNGIMTLYLNGTAVDTGSFGEATVLLHSSDAALGEGSASVWDSGNDYFDGKLDDVQVFDIALSTSEVENVYGGEIKLFQTLSLDPISNKTINSPDFAVIASASSGLPVTLEIVSGPATITGNTVSLTGTGGSVIVRASQSGDANYHPAVAVEEEFIVVNGDYLVGTILREQFNGIGGASVGDLTSAANYPDIPDISEEITIFESPSNISSSFGTRIVGYVVAPETGDYTFWIAGDDHVELYLSTDEDPANKTRIAHHTSWTSPREWTKFGTQQSAPISLVAGERYFVEALHKELGSGDNLAVGWQLPSGTLERPIPGNRLSPAIRTAAPGIDLPSAIYLTSQAVTITNADPTATIYYTLDGSSPDQTSSVYSSPITVSSNATLRAKAYGSDVLPSLIVEETYQIGVQDQTIDFSNINEQKVDGADFNISATASSGLPVSFSIVSGPASIAGNTITLDGMEGTVVVRASQGGDAYYNPAVDVDQNFDVTKYDQTISFDPIDDKQFSDPDFTITAAASSALPVSFAIISGPATVMGNTVSLTGATGTVVVRASQLGDVNYNAATEVEESFVVGSLPQPTGLTSTNLTISGADLSWTVIAGNSYNLRYRLLGETDWNEMQGVTSGFTFDSGTPRGNYEWAIQATQPGEISPYSNPETFITEDAIYLDNGVYKSHPYNYPGLDATTRAELQAIKNQDYTPAQEQAFWERATEEINYNVGRYNIGHSGNFFENEKRMIPYTLYHMINGIVNDNTGKMESAKNTLQGLDYHADGKTLGVDLYPSFTLQGQMPKYFYFSKFHNTLDKDYEQRMRDAMEEWTYDNLSFTRSFDGYTHVASGNPIDPLGREHPSYSNASGWTPAARNSWVDTRNTDNLKAMRECAIYLFTEEIGNETIRNIYKERIKRYVAALYHVGYSEWDSDPYYPHLTSAYMSLYAYTVDPEMRKLAKAALDWLMMTGASKYYRGSMAGPFKRVYNDGSSFNLRGENTHMPHAFFGGSPTTAGRKHDKHEYIFFLSGYRPPQAVYSLAHKEFEPYTEMLNTYPVYGSFSPTSTSSPAFWETMFYGKNYRLGSAVATFSDWDMKPHGLTIADATKGVEPFLVINDNQTASRDMVNKRGGDQIGQYRNLIIRLQDNEAFEFGVPDDIPLEEDNGVWFFGYDSAYIAVHPINMKIDSTGAYAAEPNMSVHYNSQIVAGNSYTGYAMEIVDHDQFPDLAAFKVAVAANPVDLSNLSSGEVTITGTDGRFLRMVYNTNNDLPTIYRNSEIAYDYGDPNNFGGRKAVTEPTATISNATETSGDVTITGSAFDPALGPVSQGWKAGTLKVIAGNHVFTSTVSADGNSVTYSEEPLQVGINDIGDLVSIELYVDGNKVADATPAEVASGNYSFTRENLKNGDVEFRIKAVDAQGNEGWSAPVVVTVTGGDGDAPAAPINVVASGNSTSSIDISWDANSESDLNTYRIYRGTTPGFTVDITNQITEVGELATSFTDNGLQKATEYFYKVTATDDALNESEASLVASGWTFDNFEIAVGEDTYVKEDDPDATFHTDGGVRVKSEVGNHWNAFVKFDIASLGAFESVKLALEGRCEIEVPVSDPNHYYPAIHAYSAGSNWTEDAITWNNSVAVAQGVTSLDNQIVESTTYRVWYEWDVTQAVQDSIAAGATETSFVLKADGANDPLNHAWFVSQDWIPANSAKLVVTTNPDPSASPNMRVAKFGVERLEAEIIQELEALEVNVYPMPASDVLQVDANRTINKLTLVTISGKTISAVANEDKIKVSNVPTGLYILLIETDEQLISKKVFIQH